MKLFIPVDRLFSFGFVAGKFCSVCFELLLGTKLNQLRVEC